LEFVIWDLEFKEHIAMRYLSSVVPRGGTKDGCALRFYLRSARLNQGT
jgi:hypothetical protein